jgi:hypothetical protein
MPEKSGPAGYGEDKLIDCLNASFRSSESGG